MLKSWAISALSLLSVQWTLTDPAGAVSPQQGGAAQPVPYIWRAQDVVDAVGVVTHVTYDANGSAYAKLDEFLAALKWLRIRSVRESLPVLPLGDPGLQRTYALLNTGIKASMVSYKNTGSYTAGYPTIMAAMKASLDNLVKKYPGQILDIEGLNEPAIVNNRFLFHYGALSGAEAVAQYQIDLYAMVKGDPLLSGLQVWEFNLNTPPYNQEMYDQIYRANPRVIHAFDVASRGVYGGYWSPIWTMGHEIVNPYDAGWDVAKRVYTYGVFNSAVAGKPLIVKETGLSAAPQGLAAFNISDYTVQAKLLPAVIFDTLVLGAQKSYIYELADLYNNPNNNSNFFGLFDNDWKVKPAARVLKNIFAALTDTGRDAKTFTPTPMNVSVHKFPMQSPGASSLGSGLTLRTQSSDGNYHIVVWYEPLLWNRATNSEFPVPSPVPITIGLSKTCARTSVYDPYQGTTTTGPGKVSQIPVMLPDHTIIVTCADPSP